MKHNQKLGHKGEQLAAVFWAATGNRVVDRNWRCAQGELDIIGVTGAGVLVAIEVKARASNFLTSPLEAITAEKLHRLRLLLTIWLREQPEKFPAIRIDAIGITYAENSLTLTHLQGLA